MKILEKVTTKTVDEQVKTNTIYFTTGCNLGCTYCYESLDEVKTIRTSREDLMKIADSVIEREPDDKQSFFILFGGEPTLHWDDVLFFMDYAWQKKKNIHFNMITNGIKFLNDDFMFEVFTSYWYKKGFISVDISYDGIEGNVDRIYKDGRSSTEDVIQVLAKLSEMKYTFRIRYTIHKKNINTIVKDIEKILQHFNPKRIITSEVTEQFDENDYVILSKTYSELRWKWQNNEIQIPICDLFCDICNGCSIRRPNLHYYVGDKDHKKVGGSLIPFNHFEKK